MDRRGIKVTIEDTDWTNDKTDRSVEWIEGDSKEIITPIANTSFQPFADDDFDIENLIV